MNKKILMIVASNGYRDEELDVPKNIFLKNGFQVIVASTTTEKAIGKLGGSISPDILVQNVITDEYDAVVFVGGPGAEEYFDSKQAHKIAVEIYEARKLVTAICIAPVVLAKAGLLRNKKATVYSSGQQEIEDMGALYTGEDVTVDGRIVTGNGPESAQNFANTIVEMLKA
jgi:protease I